MSYAGGTADKLGGQYEARWIVRCFLALLRGEAERIQLEPLPPDGEGIEFLFVRNGVKEGHQAKRKRTGAGHWSLTVLANEGVLATFKRLIERGIDPVFVSGQDADALRELSDRARGTADVSAFTGEALGATWNEQLSALRQRWEWDEPRTWSALRYCRVQVIDQKLFSRRK